MFMRYMSREGIWSPDRQELTRGPGSWPAPSWAPGPVRGYDTGVRLAFVRLGAAGLQAIR